MEEETTVAEIEEQTESFQDLIRGKYREDYLKALSEALSAQARETDRYLAYRDLLAQAEAVKTRYPDFDLDRELEDPRFARLLNGGAGPPTRWSITRSSQAAPPAWLKTPPVPRKTDWAAAPWPPSPSPTPAASPARNAAPCAAERQGEKRSFGKWTSDNRQWTIDNGQ